MQSIVVIGGNYAGASIAHYLIRHVLPSLNSPSTKPTYRVVLVSSSTHTYFKIGAPRALVSDEYLKPSILFGSIPDGFSEYDGSIFEFVHGEAIDIDPQGRKVVVNLARGGKESKEVIAYNSLVIATGTAGKSALWTMPGGDHEKTLSTFKHLHNRLHKGKTVMVVGGGTVGIESAGEIAFRGKDVTIVTGGKVLLTNLKYRGVADGAERQLNSLGVKIIYNTKVVESRELPDGSFEVVLSDGSMRLVDVLIDCTGGTPCTSFVPKTWLDEKNFVVTDGTTLRATQAPSGVYSIGDAASYSRGSILDAQWSVPALGYSIWHDLKKDGMPALKEKKYKQFQKEVQVVPIGPNGGVGVLFGWKMWNFMVWLLKARTMMVEKAPGLATGAQYMKA